MRRRYYLPERNRQEGPRGPPGRDGTSGGGNTPGNPSALIGATATNGTATTYMRSDAAPALETTGVTSGFYKSADITVDSQGRVTTASDGSAITTFRLAGDGGTQQDIVNNSVMTVGGGVGLTSTAATPETVTLDLDDTAVTPGIYKSADITVDQQGRITAASAGAQGTMSSFTVAGDGGSNQTINEGDTLLIAGGTGLTSSGSATDTLTLDLDDTAVTPGSYKSADITVDQQGRITAASAGTVAFTMDGNTGTTQTVNNGDLLTISGGSGLGLTLEAEASSVALITSSTTNKASHEGSAIYRNAYVSGTANYTSQTLFAASSPGYCKVSFRNLDMSVAFFAGLIPDAGSVNPSASDTTQFDSMYSFSHIGSDWRWNYPQNGAGTSGTLSFNDSNVNHSTTDVISVTYDGSVAGGTISWKRNGSLLLSPTDPNGPSEITNVGTNLVFHAKFEVYLTSGNTRVQEFADVTVESESSGNPRCTIVPASGTLGQQYGGTGVDFTTATDGQLLMGVTSAAASLGSITSANANIDVSFKSGTPNEITLTAKAAEISSTSGYYQVWYDSTNGLFKYFNSKSV